MKKTILFMFALIFLVSTVSALDIDEGNNLTQAQVDGINIAGLTKPLLKCQHETNYFGIDGDSYTYFRGYSCLTIKPETNLSYNWDYNIYRTQETAKVRIKDFLRCLIFNDRQECVDGFFANMQTQANQRIQAIINSISGYQTPEEQDISSDFAGNLF